MQGHNHRASVVDQHYDYDHSDAVMDNPFQDDVILHDKQDKWLINLMKILNDMHAPDYAFQQVLRWASSVKADGFQFNGNQGFSQKSNLKWMMFEMTENDKLTLHMMHAVQRASGEVAEIICYGFVPAALLLLQDIMQANQ